MQELRIVRAGLVPYAVASEWQEVLCRRRWRDEIPDVLLLLEHPHVYTLGRRFSKQHLLADQAFLAARGIEVQECDRGGSITYHGPGQLVGYPILDLRRPRGSRAGNDPEPRPDAIRYLRTLEEALIRAVRSLGVIAGRRPGLTGVWVGEAKLASIGVNVSRGVSKHGFAMNVATDLSYFEGIVACGIPEVEFTSLERLLRRAVPVEAVMGSVVSSLAKLLHRRAVSGSLLELGISPPSVASERAGGEGASGKVIELSARRSLPDAPRQDSLPSGTSGAGPGSLDSAGKERGEIEEGRI